MGCLWKWFIDESECELGPEDEPKREASKRNGRIPHGPTAPKGQST